MYSQNNEEEVIVNFFNGKVGKFIDIGGYNPFKFSNTRKLYELGWSGVYVEPSRVCFANFVKEYEKEPRIKLCNYAVGVKEGFLNFYESNGDAVSTFDEAHRIKWGSLVPFTETKVQVIDFKKFLSENIEDTLFISIDTEAQNSILFDVIPDGVFEKIKLFCIEHDNEEVKMRTRLEKLGYTQYLFNGENLIMGKQ